ncbi:hypothetical protein BD626DRAFT_171417 [Schizophyllum amplum]|uniref:Uncharacterized protein n=1 Tax=Schizophyllum amplum TaxID=97359 RepID=A0A550CR24_9AGAR|nr:hypothetical protein BD626DRAFT_171417 [Auriculariopsis ampla]
MRNESVSRSTASSYRGASWASHRLRDDGKLSRDHYGAPGSCVNGAPRPRVSRASPRFRPCLSSGVTLSSHRRRRGRLHRATVLGVKTTSPLSSFCPRFFGAAFVDGARAPYASPAWSARCEFGMVRQMSRHRPRCARPSMRWRRWMLVARRPFARSRLVDCRLSAQLPIVILSPSRIVSPRIAAGRRFLPSDVVDRPPASRTNLGRWIAPPPFIGE